MKPIATIDCETDPFKYGEMPEPFIWGFYDGENYEEFTETAEIAKYLDSFDGYVFAHNGGKFDYHFLLPFGDHTRIKIINGRLAEFRIGKARLRDSYNILPVPLAKLNKADFEYWKLKRECRELYMKEISQYLYSDCVNLHYFVREFIERYGLNLTLASAAFKQWKGLGNEITPTSGKHYEKYSPWYFGGRVSPFRPGLHESDSGPYHVYDINSAYPRAMLEEHPYGTDCKYTIRPFDREIPRSFLEVECYSKGAFPLRNEKGGIDFPVGFGRYFVTGHEFISAIETGTISQHKIVNGYVFKNTINFKDYVDYFYAIKNEATKNGDKAGREFAKLFLNTLYGKFASNPNRYRDYCIGFWGDEPPEGFTRGPVISEVQIYEKELEEHQKRWYDIVIAASITGWVRAFLWRAIQAVDTPYYCDTDSIICRDGSALPLSDRVGDWEHEGTAHRLAIAGKKLYCAWMEDGTHKIASKGARLKPDDILTLAKGGHISYYQDAPTFSMSYGARFTSRKIKPTVELPL